MPDVTCVEPSSLECHPQNPRPRLAEAEVAELRASIEVHGQRQPCVVRPVGENSSKEYQVVTLHQPSPTLCLLLRGAVPKMTAQGPHDPIRRVGMNEPRGSLWRKWDLHVHTPASFDWHGMQFAKMTAPQKATALDAIVDRLNQSEVAVFAIQDHWTFDGYKEIRSYLDSQPPGRCTKTILPGIELRVQAPADFKLNYHVIFSDALGLPVLDTFLHKLRFWNALPPLPVHVMAYACSL